MSERAVCLLSGGMDSTTLLAKLLDDKSIVGVLPVAFDYGQRHRTELNHAAQVSVHYGLQLEVIDLRMMAAEAMTGNSLTDDAVEVPLGHYADESMKATVVPNRNMIFISIATALAISRGAGIVAYAAHAGDHAIYPDCRPEFASAQAQAVLMATDGAVRLLAPFINMNKYDIAITGINLSAPLHLTWSCYEGRALHCGRCGTCVERIEAFHDAGVIDPTTYEEID